MQVKLAMLEPIVQPEMPRNLGRRQMWKFVQHPLFERFFVTVILLNTVLMTTDSYEGNPTWLVVSFWINVIFILCYVFEMACKLIAQSMGFFSSGRAQSGGWKVEGAGCRV